MSTSRYWQPAICTTSYQFRPPVGVLIGHRGDAWSVVRVEALNPGDWSERARDEWLSRGMPDPWTRAPFRVVVTKPGGGTELTMAVQPWHSIRWHILPEHYAVCASCGDLAPCAGHEQAVEAERSIERAEENMRLPDGFCPACKEPITDRQKFHAFPGPNLLNPLGADVVRFHTRRMCSRGAARYEESWVKADPTRERSLLTLSCEGCVIVHGDGSGECHGAADCPTIYARHRGMSACFLQSHGCPLGCATEGHPGTRLASPSRTD